MTTRSAKRTSIDSATDDPLWTSHSAYLGATPPIPRLDVSLGLELCGCPNDQVGRARFDTLVRARAADDRNPDLSDIGKLEARSRKRQELRAPVEVTSAVLGNNGLRHDVVQAHNVPIHPRHVVQPRDVLVAVSERSGFPLDVLASRDRRWAVANARRLAVMVWRRLGLPLVDITRALGISVSEGCHLLQRRSAWGVDLASIADVVVAQLLSE